MDLSEDQRNISNKLSLKLSQHPNILHGSSDHKTQSLAAHFSRLFDIKVLSDYMSWDVVRLSFSDKIRYYLISMIKTVLDLHGHGISVLKLDDSNIVIHDETVKFCGLVYINASDDTRKNDMQSLGGAIKKLIQSQSILQSLYLDDLLRLMSDYSDSQRDLLLNHMALKSAFQRSIFIIQSSKISNLRGDRNLERKYHSAVDDISRSEKNSEDWTQRIKCLKGPVKDCFEYQPPPSIGYRNTNLDMLRFCGNKGTHLHQHLRKAKYKGRYKGTIEEVDYIIMQHFGAELLSFQKLAHEKGILKYLMPDYASSPALPKSSVGPKSSSAGPSSVVPLSSAGSSSAVPPSSTAQSQVSYKSMLLGIK